MPLVAAVVLVVAITTVFTLFVRSKDIPPPEPVSPTRHLEERKAAIYENLRDLQFEYRVGKLSDADYQQTKTGLQKELAAVLAQIEQVGKPLAGARGSEPPIPGSPIPSRDRKGAGCPHCGASFPTPMKFCGECGKAMS